MSIKIAKKNNYTSRLHTRGRMRERGQGAERRGAAGSQAQELARFCFLPFAFLALYFTVFTVFSVFLDKFIRRAAFFENRRQFRALLALC